jgi:hypothetical protein
MVNQLRKGCHRGAGPEWHHGKQLVVVMGEKRSITERVFLVPKDVFIHENY